MPTKKLYIMGLWRDSFEAQTDRMSAADAQSVLLDKIRAVTGSASFETAWINAPKETPSRSNDDPLANALVLLREIEELKLQLGQRRTGQRRVPSAIAEDILGRYEGELFLEDHPRPKKKIIGDLAREYGLTDGAIREIIRRAHGKKKSKK